MLYPKPKKKTKEEKIKDKLEKRRALENKWRKSAMAKKKPIKTKRKKRTKKHTKSWYIKKLDIIFSKVVRTRDKYCQKCGTTESLHCSHVVPKSQSWFLRWHETNAKAMCFGCHIAWWHKDVLAARDWFAKKFPDRHTWLEGQRHKTVKRTLDDYKKIYDDLNIRFKELSDNV